MSSILSKLTRKLVPSLYYAALACTNKRQQHQQKLHASLDSTKPVTLFWMHDAGVVFHAISQCIFARALVEQGHQVLMITCSGQLERCTVHDSNNLPLRLVSVEKKRSCLHCHQQSLKLAKHYGLACLSLDDLPLETQQKQLQSALKNQKSRYEDFAFDGVAYGKIALGEAIRHFKLSTLNPAGEKQAHIKQHIQACVTNAQAFAYLAKQFSVQRVVYFGDYGNVLGVVQKCMQQKIPVTNLSHALLSNVQRHRVTMMGPLSTDDQFWRLSQWPQWKSVPLTPHQIEEIAHDSYFRQTGSGFTVFSPNRKGQAHQLFEQLGLCKKRKLVVAYTSSLDEALSTKVQYDALGVPIYQQQRPFEDQVQWLTELAEHVESSSNLQLVVRIHPRENTDGYRQRASEHLKVLRAALTKPYQNVTVIWPQQNISSYDLGELADLVAIGWTSLGLEFARLGVPVLLAFPFCPYPDFIEYVPSQKQYFERLQALVNSVGRFEHIQQAYRWFYIARFSHAIDISDMAPESDFCSPPAFKQPKQANAIQAVLVEGAHPSALNLEQQKRNDPEQERTALLNALKAILSKLLSQQGQNPQCITVDAFFWEPSSQTIRYQPSSTQLKPGEIRVQFDKAATMYSPLLYRLIHIVGHEYLQATSDESAYAVL